MRASRGKGFRARGRAAAWRESRRRAAPVLVAGAIALVGPAWARAEGSSSTAPPERHWVSVGAHTGWLQPDSKLADYQWDTSPRWTLGGEALGGLGRFAAGLRVQRFETVQELGALATPPAAAVRATSSEATAKVRVASVGRIDLLVTAGAGLLHLTYAPDRAQVDAGTGTPIAVTLRPIDEWIGGVGVAFERPIAGPWRTGLTLEQRVFSMETAHRNGPDIERRSESFDGWSAKLGLAWRHSF